jgi:uncharacterized protein (DUF2252 family)
MLPCYAKPLSSHLTPPLSLTHSSLSPPLQFYRGNTPLYYTDMKSETAGVRSSSVYEENKGIAWLSGDMHILNMVGVGL